ncbi:MAG: hypothetical protein R2844_21895 [Caldilineales bacterium]
MRLIILILLLLGAHFSLTALAPGPLGKGKFYWPFGPESQPVIGVLGSAARPVTQLLAVVAGACFLLAAIGLFNVLVPAAWWPPLVVAGAVTSVVLHLLYLSQYAVLPLLVDAVLLWSVVARGWTVPVA